MPRPDRSAAAALGRTLRKLRYDEETILDLLGDEAYSTEPADLVVHAKRLPDSKLGTAIRLLLLGLTVPRSAVRHALGEKALAALAATELAEVGDDVVPLARISSVQDVLLASDTASVGAGDPTDYVAGYTPTARFCDALTPRPKVTRALDVGTGCGVHAVLAAQHARHVVATDVNPRALAYTEVSAALNEVDNVEVRTGSFFEPVTGETFDLIVCNAPYVVSPETRWIYRDTELPGDQVSERLVRETAAHLAPGGFATLSVSWVATDPDDPHSRALEWVARTGCDAWILPSYGADPLEHAAGWNDHLDGDIEAFRSTVEHWEADLHAAGIQWVNEGAIVLHRRRGRVGARVDEVDEDELEVADAQLRRAFAARAARLRPRELVKRRLALARRAHVEQELRHGQVVAARVVLEEGTQPVVEIPPRLAEPIARLDGKAQPSFEPKDGRVLRELLELGILRLADL
jgi:hypothetical protein